MIIILDYIYNDPDNCANRDSGLVNDAYAREPTLLLSIPLSVMMALLRRLSLLQLCKSTKHIKNINNINKHKQYKHKRYEQANKSSIFKKKKQYHHNFTK